MSAHRAMLVCPSRSWGVAYGATGILDERCKGKFCRTANGEAVIHRFDLATGSQRTYPADAVAEIDTPQEDTGHARNANL